MTVLSILRPTARNRAAITQTPPGPRTPRPRPHDRRNPVLQFLEAADAKSLTNQPRAVTVWTYQSTNRTKFRGRYYAPLNN